MRTVKAHEIKEMDRQSVHEIGIPGAVLMENAARGACRIFLEHFNPAAGARAVIICGPGNNGGDGYVMARYLHQAGLTVTVIVLAEFSRISGDALINFEIIQRLNIKIRKAADTEEWAGLARCLEECDFIIDGILGTGLNSPVRGLYGQVIEKINESGKPVMAIDIPSGLNADTGRVMGTAVKAALTVTFGFPKLGQIIFPGVEFVGRLTRVDIGIPNRVTDRVRALYHIIEPDHFTSLLRVPKRDIHKGDRGHLLILAGSRGKTGAAALTALGALRAGAGLVTLGIPESLNTILEVKLTEAMTVPLPETEEGSLSPAGKKEIFKLMKGKTAIAIGPGLSTNPETSNLVREIVRERDLPMVIDADGLNALAAELKILKELDRNVILTPHPGEMGGLTGLKSADVQQDRVGISERFVQDYGCHLVLKGARTLIVEPEGSTFINTTGNPSLASGGSGDVLTGVISGFMARRWPTVKAAIAGAYLHGLAADFLSEELGEAGVLAGQLPDVLPELMTSLSNNEWPLREPPFMLDLYQPL